MCGLQGLHGLQGYVVCQRQVKIEEEKRITTSLSLDPYSSAQNCPLKMAQKLPKS